MLSEILQYLRNYFEKTKYFSDFTISDGSISFTDGSQLHLESGQYFRIVGSIFNNGVHEYGNAELIDETFTGAVWALAVPPTIVSLAGEIDSWTAANADAINSPYQSESFGGYSYSLKAGSSSGDGNGMSWKSQFAARLAPWRKI